MFPVIWCGWNSICDMVFSGSNIPITAHTRIQWLFNFCYNSSGCFRNFVNCGHFGHIQCNKESPLRYDNCKYIKQIKSNSSSNLLITTFQSFALLLIIVVAEVSAVIWGYMNREALELQIRTAVKSTVQEKYHQDKKLQELFDTFQEKVTNFHYESLI